LRKDGKTSKTLRARELGVSRGSLYYKAKKPEQDWNLKCCIKEVLRNHPSYGSRRIAIELNINRKRIKRVMNLYGIKAYRRRGKKWRKPKTVVFYPNLLMTTYPTYPNHVWVADFTYLLFKKRTVYVATVLDVYTRKIVGLSVLTTHAVPLVLSALLSAIHHHARPLIFHSDNGSEYNSVVFRSALETLGISISRSRPGCPWENGYQESFYSQFKIDLGDPSRFGSLGELVFAIYHTIYEYNNNRIHSALKMSPVLFAQKVAREYNLDYKIGV